MKTIAALATILLASCGAQVTPEGATAWLGVIEKAKIVAVDTAKDIQEIKGDK